MFHIIRTHEEFSLKPNPASHAGKNFRQYIKLITQSFNIEKFELLHYKDLRSDILQVFQLPYKWGWFSVFDILSF